MLAAAADWMKALAAIGYQPPFAHMIGHEKRCTPRAAALVLPASALGCAMRLTLLLVAALLATPAFAAVTCCQDANGDPYDGCTCLPDNSLLRSQAVAADEYAYYHWAISDYSLTMDDDDARMIEFRVWPCSGDVTLLVAAVSSAFPTNETARWRHHVEGGAETSIRVGLLYAEYFVSVLASSDANFTIGAFTARACLRLVPPPATSLLRSRGSLPIASPPPPTLRRIEPANHQ